MTAKKTKRYSWDWRFLPEVPAIASPAFTIGDRIGSAIPSLEISGEKSIFGEMAHEKAAIPCGFPVA
ncbi:hypothetical protein ACFDAU_08565 [Sulfuriferula sp. GW1]|uniref:hypothetical protein n=1 Tax=Sulfuriferula sp. GW1 TaxID=3345111 RepID=UPI0039B0EB42